VPPHVGVPLYMRNRSGEVFLDRRLLVEENLCARLGQQLEIKQTLPLYVDIIPHSRVALFRLRSQQY
jgi:hypothetical protein